MYRLSLLLVMVLSLTACASSALVKDVGLDELPVVRIDQSIPERGEYILHFPSGYEVKTLVTLQGNLITTKPESVLDAVLSKDIYVYKDRVSFDRKTWSKGQDVFSFTVDVQLPDYEDPYSSQIDMRLDAR